MTNTSPHAVDSGYEPWARSAVARRDIPISYEMAIELLDKLDKARARVADLEKAVQFGAAAELRRLADQYAAGCEEYIANGASEIKRAQAVEALTIAKGLRKRADELQAAKVR